MTMPNSLRQSDCQENRSPLTRHVKSVTYFNKYRKELNHIIEKSREEETPNELELEEDEEEVNGFDEETEVDDAKTVKLGHSH